MKLREYRKKRTPGATNEPFGGEPPEISGPTTRGAYVVHLHDATRRHYDLRLEKGGVLASFAVPHGPTLDPTEKHLAVHTEDHPLEYLDFEDVIPEKQYGAGPMIVWDKGRVEFLEHPAEEGLEKGKLDFVLDGMKLHGRFALVRLKKGNGNDWLLFKKKDAWAAEGRDIVHELPRSVLSGLEVEELERAGDIGAALEAEAAARGAKQGHIEVPGAKVVVPTEAKEAPAGPGWLHEIAFGGVRVLAAKNDAHDGVVVHDGRDVSELYPEVARAVRALAPSRVVLDGEIVAFDEAGRPSPARLEKRAARVRSGDAHGAIVDAPVVMLVGDVLAIGAYDLRKLSLETRRELLARLLLAMGVLRATDAFGAAAPIVAFCKEHALPGVLSRKCDAPYVDGQKPSRTWRHVTITRQAPLHVAAAPPPEPSRHVAITNRQKVFFRPEGYTKGDLVDYYRTIAPAILPYLRERPISVVRYPDGIDGKSFYQWNVPPGMPKWVSSFALRDEGENAEEKRVFIVNDIESLVYIANLACIPIHVLACRRDTLDQCDFLTLDFDLKLAKLEHAVVHARTLRELLTEIGLVGYPKTSGQTGLHVLVPLGPGISFVTARALADLLGQLVVREHPKTATMERIVKKRGDKVYVDTGQTGPTRTIVSPYSVRATPGATVSTPLSWDEVDGRLDPKRYTIRTVPGRFADMGDPMRPMLDARPDVPAAVAKLDKMLRRRS